MLDGRTKTGKLLNLITKTMRHRYHLNRELRAARRAVRNGAHDTDLLITIERNPQLLKEELKRLKSLQSQLRVAEKLLRKQRASNLKRALARAGKRMVE